MRVTLTGDGSAITAALTAMAGAGEKVAKAALAAEMPAVVEAARALTPVANVDGGQLKASVRMLRPTVVSGGIAGGVLAGGAPLAGERRGDVYAMVQHEDLSLHHDDGQAKFVERPFVAALPRILKAVEDALGAEMARAR